MAEISVDLVDICLRAISAWQYLDCKLTTAKLTSIVTKCPYSTNMPTPNNIPESEIAEKLFAISGYDKISFKEKQVMYWQIRLRFACGIIPIAILKMIPDLRKLGYKLWKLPDGRTTPLESIWLGDLAVVPKDLHTVQTDLSVGSQTLHSVIEPVEGFGGLSTQGPYVQHSVIVVKENSENETIHILDPTCLQFGMLGINSRLVMYTSLEIYVKSFPGIILNTELTHGQDSVDRLETKWKIGNMGFNHCEKLIKAIVKEIGSAACGHCGETELNIRLSNCGRCRKVKYCDKLCQKASWKFHSSNCSSDGSSTETAS